MSDSGSQSSEWLRILVVDDTPVALKGLKFILSGLGHKVVTAKCGEEAIELFDASIDVIFMDFYMPNINGDVATKTIRKKELAIRKNKSTYIIGITANDSEEIIGSCLESGMDKVVIKPIHPESVEELLRGLMN